MIVAWKPFSKLYCVLSMLAKNHLASDSPSLIPVDEVKLNRVFMLTSLQFASPPGHLQAPLNGGSKGRNKRVEAGKIGGYGTAHGGRCWIPTLTL